MTCDPPSLQALVEAHGIWDKIPEQTWQKYNKDLAEWQAKMRFGEFPSSRL